MRGRTIDVEFRRRDEHGHLGTSGRYTAHQHYPSEVTIRYRFHPLRGSCFPVIRLHYVYEEPCYVVRRPNGLPLSFPVWMTELRAAQIEIVCQPRLTLSTLLDLRRLVTLYLSSLGSTDSEGSHDVAGRIKAGTTIRGEQIRPRTTTTSPGGSTSGNRRTGAVDKSTGKGDRSGGGQ